MLDLFMDPCYKSIKSSIYQKIKKIQYQIVFMKESQQLRSSHECIRQLSKLQQKYQTPISQLLHHRSVELHNPFQDLRITIQSQHQQIISLKKKIKAMSSHEQKRKPIKSQNIMTESHEIMRMQEWMSQVEQKVSDFGIFVVEILAQISPEDETVEIGLGQLQYLLEFRKKYLLQVQLSENEQEEEKEFEKSMQRIYQEKEELRANLYLQKMIEQLQNLSPTDFFIELSLKLGLQEKWNVFYKPLKHSSDILYELRQYLKPQRELPKQPVLKQNSHFEQNQKSLVTIERVISILEVSPNLSRAFFDFKCNRTANEISELCLQEIYKKKEAAFKQEQDKRREQILSVLEDVFREFLRSISGLFRTDTRPIYSNSAALNNQYPYKFHDNLKNSFVNQNWKTLKEQLFAQISQIFKAIHRKCQFFARCSISLV